MEKPTGFRNPPQWFHESVAARFFAPLAARREARRRAVLVLIDELEKDRGLTPIFKRLSSRAAAARRSRS